MGCLKRCAGGTRRTGARMNTTTGGSSMWTVSGRCKSPRRPRLPPAEAISARALPNLNEQTKELWWQCWHLWEQQSKKGEARQMLAEIYGWFTEGFDTRDLQEAKVLLQELA